MTPGHLMRLDVRGIHVYIIDESGLTLILGIYGTRLEYTCTIYSDQLYIINKTSSRIHDSFELITGVVSGIYSEVVTYPYNPPDISPPPL